MSKILYSHGDSVVWGAELENKQTERFSHYLANHYEWLDLFMRLLDRFRIEFRSSISKIVPRVLKSLQSCPTRRCFIL